jgi:hypothetical protein
MQAAQNAVLDRARVLDPSIENFNDLDRIVQEHPEWDEEIAEAYRQSGYLDLWKADFAINPWHYDLAAMDATGATRGCGLIVSARSANFIPAARFAVNLIHYQGR